MSIPLSATKVHPPYYLGSSSAAKSFQPVWILRERLVNQLGFVQTGEPVFLVSPNGSGKTTLLQSWLTPAIPGEGYEAPVEGMPAIVWLTLDQGDNDPARFLTALIGVVQLVQPGFGLATLSSIDAPRPPAMLIETASLLQEIAHIPRPITLVLDEYETISSSRIHQALVFLLSNIPDNLRIVVASGADLPPELDEARQRNRWKTITFQDLRLSLGEITELLEFYARKNITENQAQILLERTQGMAFALQMAGLALMRHPDPDTFWKELEQQPAPALEYLLDQFLQQQMDSVREFLICTSILNKLTGTLCDILLSISPSGLQTSDRGRATLEYLSKNRLFTYVVDPEHTWFRYHPEFSRLLVDQLKQSYPTLIDPLHQRASQWLEINDEVEEAIGHALAANDELRASVLIEMNALTLISTGQISTALTLLGKLSAGLVLLRPWLSLAEAWAVAHEGWKEAVEILLSNVETAADTMASPAAQRARGHMAAIRSQITLSDRDTSRMEKLCRQALELLPPQDRTIRCYIATELGTTLRQRGHLNSAAEAYSEAIVCTTQGQNRSASVLAFCLLADLHFLEGMLQKSLALSEEAINLAETHHLQAGQSLPKSGLAHLYAGIVLLEWDDLDAAQTHLETSLKHCLVLGQWDAVALSYAVLASMHRAYGNLEAARQAVSKSLAYLSKFQAENARLPKRSASFLAFKPERIHARLIRLQASWGDWQAVQEWLERNQYGSDDSFTYEQAPVYTTLAQVLLAQNRILEARRLVRRLIQINESVGAIYQQVQALVLQARLYLRVQNYASAMAALQRAIQLAEPEKMVRVFIDDAYHFEPASLFDLNLHIKRLSEGGPGSAHARIIQSSLDRQIARTTPLKELTAVPTPPVTIPMSTLGELPGEAITDRERLVLSYLESYLSVMDIASHLSLSRRTVDTIVRNLYRKLGVSDPNQAVQRARELGIL
jgi:LuxR family transcriptional regulator, maltose regulon positive regulatory protein